jgi:hypothetical protein
MSRGFILGQIACSSISHIARTGDLGVEVHVGGHRHVTTIRLMWRQAALMNELSGIYVGRRGQKGSLKVVDGVLASRLEPGCTFWLTSTAPVEIVYLRDVINLHYDGKHGCSGGGRELGCTLEVGTGKVTKILFRGQPPMKLFIALVGVGGFQCDAYLKCRSVVPAHGHA